MATQHLIGLGHRASLEISGPLTWHEALSRHESYVATLNRSNLSPAAIVERHGLDAPHGYDAAYRLLDQGEEFSAVLSPRLPGAWCDPCTE